MAVEIDEAIRRDPELLRDVEAATNYLRSLPERVPPPMSVKWLTAGVLGNYFLELADAAAFDPIRHAVRRSQLRSRPEQESVVRWAWIELLGRRLDVARSQVESTLAELEAEEALGR